MADHGGHCRAAQGLAPANSIEETDPRAFDNEEAVDLLRTMGEFENAARRSAEQYEPSILTQNIVDISDRANRFYNAHHVLVEDVSIARSRLLLVWAVATLLKTGLSLLGVSAPDEM